MKNQILNLFTNIRPEPLDNKSVLFNFNIAPNTNLKDSYVVEILNKLFNMSRDARIGNIAIASAITAYARCDIDRYKRLPGITCFYSDTDCVHLSAPLPPEFIGDEIGKMKNELSDSNYSISNDASYYYSKGLFLRDKVYSIVLKNGTQITKFSGLNRRLIPENCFNILYESYITGNPLKFRNEILKRDIGNLRVSHVELDKVFSFNYDKRLQVYENGIWVDTKPIFIKPGANVSKAIRKELLNNDPYGLVPFRGSINRSAICNSSYKQYDGYFLNYTLPVDQSVMATLSSLIDLASSEGVLVPGVHYLLTEYYSFKKNTISYMNNYVSKEELLNIYSQHIDSVLSQGVSGSLLDENGAPVYLVDKLSLRIQIPKS